MATVTRTASVTTGGVTYNIPPDVMEQYRRSGYSDDFILNWARTQGGRSGTTTPTARPTPPTTPPAARTASYEPPTFLDVVGDGSAAVDLYLKLRNQQKQGAIDKKVAEFNRRNDLANVRLFLQRMKDEQSAWSLRRYAAEVDYYTGLAMKDAARDERAYYAARTRPETGFLAWLSGEERRIAVEEAEIGYLDTLADIRLQRGRIDMAEAVDTRRLPGMRRVAASDAGIYQGSRLAARAQWDEHAVRRVSAAQVAESGRTLEGAQERLSEGTLEQQERLGRAEAGRFQAQRQQIRARGAIQRARTIEGAQRAIGSAVAGGAARGARGSFALTAGAEAFTAMQSELSLQHLDQIVADLQLTEAEATGGRARIGMAGLQYGVADAERGLRATQRERGLLDTEAQLDTADARTHLTLTQAHGRFTERGEARAVEFVEVGERGKVRREERAVQERRRIGAVDRRRHATERAEIRRRQGVQDIAKEGIAYRQAEASFQRGRQQVRSGLTKGFEVNRQRWYAQAGQAIAQWQLDNLPDLPDYEATQTRQSLNIFMQSLAGFI